MGNMHESLVGNVQDMNIVGVGFSLRIRISVD